MVEHGLIEAKGSGKNRSYMLGAQIYAAAHETAAYVRQVGIERVTPSGTHPAIRSGTGEHYAR